VLPGSVLQHSRLRLRISNVGFRVKGQRGKDQGSKGIGRWGIIGKDKVGWLRV